MQGNTTEIDERNLLRLDALLSHGYGLSPQLVMRSKGLSIEAKALYGYLSSFAGAGDTAFPSTSRILEELDISKNRFYKIRKELVSWGFISIETTATSAGLRTVYTLPQNPIAIKTEIDEIANRRNEIKSSLVANLHNEDMVSHKGDSESERLQQSAGNEPCRQSEAKAQNRGSNLKPCLQSEDEGCLQSGDKLYIDTNINPKVSIDRSAAHPSDDEGPSDWKVTEGMTDPTQRDDGESDRDANRRDALDAVPDGTYDPLPTVADGYTLSNSEFEAFNHLCSLSIKTVRGAVRNEAAKQYAKRLGEGYSPATIEKAYIDYAEAYRQNNPSPRFAKQLSDWFVKSDGFAYFAKKPVIRTTTATKATSGQDSDLRAATEAKNDRLTLAATDPTFRDLEAAVSKARSLWGHACMTSDVENASRLKEEWSKATERAKNLADRYSDDRVQIGICQDAQAVDLIQEKNRLKTAVELIEKEITAYEQRSRDLYLKRATDGMSIDDFNSALSRIRNDVDKLRLKSKRASSELLHLNESIAAESIRMETVLKAADFNRLDKTKVSMLIESVYVHKRDPKSGTQAIDITWKF